VTLLADPPLAGVGAEVVMAPRASERGDGSLPGLGGLISGLEIAPSVPPPDSAHLARTVASVFGPGSDVAPQLLTGLVPRLGPGLYRAWASATIPAGTPLDSAVTQRVKAGVFGATAPPQPVTDASGVVAGSREWPLTGTITARIDVVAQADPVTTAPQITVTVSDPLGQAGSTAFPASAPPSGPVQLTAGADGVSVTVAAPSGLGLEVRPEMAVPPTFVLVFTFSGAVTASPEISGDYALGNAQVTVAGTAYQPGPGQLIRNSGPEGGQVISLTTPTGAPARLSVAIDAWAPPAQPAVIDLDAQYDQVVPGSWAVIERADTGAAQAYQVLKVASVARTGYGISGKITSLTLDTPWLAGSDRLLTVARAATVYVQSDAVTPARVADPSAVQGATIELDGLFGGLPTGRWLIITGERSDLPGVTTGEVVMIAGVTQGATLPGDTVHTTVLLSAPLAYSYVRGTVTIYGNVVAATQGATQRDVLGSGAASRAGQSFSLSRGPLTYLPAATAAGAASTLVTSANGVAWQEVGNLASAGPADHVYMTQADATGKTTVLFGDGGHGARLPTGAANVTAIYRVGLGAGGNLAAGQISQPQTRPQGVQGVTNPLPSSGGADPDTVPATQANAPLAVMALDRVVSVQDYQDFARAWAGLGQASSVLLSDGLSQFVHLTIGGTTSEPIETSSALYAGLVASLAASGDPHLPVLAAPCQISLIVLAGGVHVTSGYQWSDVSAAARSALLSAYSYGSRSLGQAVVLSDIVAVIQAVPGVDYATVTGLALATLSDDPASMVAQLNGLAATLSAPPASISVPLAAPVRIRGNVPVPPPWVITPAQVAILTPDVPDSLVLTQMVP
jgi:predicted phage baseplate assembly protein